jgi:hypothetical protein
LRASGRQTRAGGGVRVTRPEDSPDADVLAGLENIRSAAGATKAALDLTRDVGARGTIWHVFDRKTGQMHKLAQGDFGRT